MTQSANFNPELDNTTNKKKKQIPIISFFSKPIANSFAMSQTIVELFFAILLLRIIFLLVGFWVSNENQFLEGSLRLGEHLSEMGMAILLFSYTFGLILKGEFTKAVDNSLKMSFEGVAQTFNAKIQDVTRTFFEFEKKLNNNLQKAMKVVNEFEKKFDDLSEEVKKSAKSVRVAATKELPLQDVKPQDREEEFDSETKNKVEMAENYALEKNYKEGIATLESIPDFLSKRRILKYLGTQYLADKNFKKAIEILKKAQEADRNNENIQHNLGLAYYHNEQYKEAEKELESSSKLGVIESYNNLGLVKWKLEKYDKAIDATKAFIERMNIKGPEFQKRVAVGCNNVAYYLWEIARQSDFADDSNYSDAVNNALLAIELNPKNAKFRDTYGCVLCWGEQYETAIQELSRSLADEPNNELAREHLTMCLQKLDEIKEKVEKDETDKKN